MRPAPQARQLPAGAERLPRVPVRAGPSGARRPRARGGERRGGASPGRGRAGRRPSARSSVAASRSEPRTRAGQRGWRRGADALERVEGGEKRRRRHRPEARETREPVRASPTRASQSGIAAGATPHFAADAGVVVDEVAPPVAQDDASPRTTCARSLSGVQTRTCSTSASAAKRSGRRRQRVVRLELDHRPERDPERDDRLLRHGELGEEVGGDAGLGLVAGPEIVAERADHPVVGAGDVRGALVPEQREERPDEPGDRGEGHPVAAADRRTRRVVRPEELVGRVDEVDAHGPVGDRVSRRGSQRSPSPRRAPTRRSRGGAPGRPGRWRP